MTESIGEQLQYLRMSYLHENWQRIMEKAKTQQPSYTTFLTNIIELEYQSKQENARGARIKRANIPIEFSIETFPFVKQLKLDRKRIMDEYDSLDYIKMKKDLVFIGPTGCGKTGLATSFLVGAINAGYRGLFCDFSRLLRSIRQAKGDYSEQKLINKLLKYDILLIDELGYMPCDSEQAGFFFDILRQRNNNKTTIITTQLGFDEWISFLNNTHLTAALLDRITSNCLVFNMKDCISIRDKNVRLMNVDTE